MEKYTYKIRFNTDSKTAETCWRIIDEKNNETLVKDIIITAPCFTSKDWMEDRQEYKYHISTTGNVSFKEDATGGVIAIITDK